VDEFEMKVYDAKVYKATMSMHSGQSAKLKSLSIPFFGVSPTLIVPAENHADNRITEKELLESQARMLKYLEETT
jgi:hypothetical protein